MSRPPFQGPAPVAARVIDIASIAEREFHENEIRKDFVASERVAILDTLERKPLGDQKRSQNFATVDDAAKRAGFGNRETARHAKKVVDRGAPELGEAMDAAKIYPEPKKLKRKQNAVVRQFETGGG